MKRANAGIEVDRFDNHGECHLNALAAFGASRRFLCYLSHSPALYNVAFPHQIVDMPHVLVFFTNQSDIAKL